MGAPEENTTLIYGLHLRESANDGSDFTNAATDYRVVFLGEDGELHKKDSSGTVTDFAGTGIAATLADNAGDMLVASGADAWTKLATPTVNGQTIQRVSGSPAWALPPGYEFDYAQITSNVTPSNTSEGAADTVVTGNAVTYDGSTIVMIEFFCAAARPDGTAGRSMTITLVDGGTSIGTWCVLNSPASNSNNHGLCLRRRLTPSAASHTYGVEAYVSAGTGLIAAGAGGAGTVVPAYIRQTKA